MTETKKPARLKAHRVEFRITNDMFRILQLKSLENKMGNNPSKYARKIVEDFLRLDNDKIIKKAINNLYEETRNNRKLTELLLRWTESYMRSFFAFSPEIPKENQVTVAKAASKRADMFFKSMLSLANEDTILAEIIADNIERKGENNG